MGVRSLGIPLPDLKTVMWGWKFGAPKALRFRVLDRRPSRMTLPAENVSLS